MRNNGRIRQWCTFDGGGKGLPASEVLRFYSQSANKASLGNHMSGARHAGDCKWMGQRATDNYCHHCGSPVFCGLALKRWYVDKQLSDGEIISFILLWHGLNNAVSVVGRRALP